VAISALLMEIEMAIGQCSADRDSTWCDYRRRSYTVVYTLSRSSKSPEWLIN
jgi:hypothetical protein